MKKNIPKEEIISLNNKLLFKDFSIEELELRLETDPLCISTLFDMENVACVKCTCHEATTFDT